MHSIDCRCQTRVATAARKLGLIRPEHAVALSLLMTHKAIGLDRRMPETDYETLDLPGTGTLPIAVPGASRHDGCRKLSERVGLVRGDSAGDCAAPAPAAALPPAASAGGSLLQAAPSTQDFLHRVLHKKRTHMPQGGRPLGADPFGSDCERIIENQPYRCRYPGQRGETPRRVVERGNRLE